MVFRGICSWGEGETSEVSPAGTMLETSEVCNIVGALAARISKMNRKWEIFFYSSSPLRRFEMN